MEHIVVEAIHRDGGEHGATDAGFGEGTHAIVASGGDADGERAFGAIEGVGMEGLAIGGDRVAVGPVEPVESGAGGEVRTQSRAGVIEVEAIRQTGFEHPRAVRGAVSQAAGLELHIGATEVEAEQVAFILDGEGREREMGEAFELAFDGPRIADVGEHLPVVIRLVIGHSRIHDAAGAAAGRCRSGGRFTRVGKTILGTAAAHVMPVAVGGRLHGIAQLDATRFLFIGQDNTTGKEQRENHDRQHF